eukprot:Skav211343  [mRNA]  locus=scaffold2081:73242:73829:+ [translate_table: standard]
MFFETLSTVKDYARFRAEKHRTLRFRSCDLGSATAQDPRTIAAMSAPTMRPPVTVSGAPIQVVSKSAAYPAGAPVTYYRPAAPGVPGAPVPGAPVPGGAPVTYPAGYVMPQGRVIQSVTAPPVTQAPVQSRIIRTSQVATPLPLGKSPPMSQATRPNTVGGPAYSQSAYETKHEKDEQLQNLTLGAKGSGIEAVE